VLEGLEVPLRDVSGVGHHIYAVHMITYL